MDDHPLVRFVDGPAGRRAALLGSGTDVWEVTAAVRDNGGGEPMWAGSSPPSRSSSPRHPGDEVLANAECWL